MTIKKEELDNIF
jgi:hypothetical protein